MKTNTKLNEEQIAEVNAIAFAGRNAVIEAVRAALKERTGKAWSVKGGRGTAWGWIQIDTTPKRATCHTVKKAGAVSNHPDDYERKDTGVPGGVMTDAERAELAGVLGLETVHQQGESVAASTAYYRVIVARAKFGTAGDFTAEPYWD
jgi:hypothetical protein